MKVLKPGSLGPPDNWTARVRCTGTSRNDKGCGALLEISAKDLYLQEWEGPVAGGGWDPMVECSQCGASNEVGRIPLSVVNSIKKRRRI